MNNFSALDKFIKAVRTAKDHNSKEIRLTISEADAVSDCLTALLLQERELSQKIMHLQDQLMHMKTVVAPTPQDVTLNGGKF